MSSSSDGSDGPYLVIGGTRVYTGPGPKVRDVDRSSMGRPGEHQAAQSPSTDSSDVSLPEEEEGLYEGIEGIVDPDKWDKLIEDIPGFLVSNGDVDEQGYVEDIVGCGDDRGLPNEMVSYAEMHSTYDLGGVKTRMNRSQFGKGKRDKHLAKEDRRTARAVERGERIGQMDAILKEFVQGDQQVYEVPISFKKAPSRQFMGLARLYNVKASLVRRSKKRTEIVLERTPGSRLPTGQDEEDRMHFFAREHQAIEAYVTTGEFPSAQVGPRGRGWVPPKKAKNHHNGVPHGVFHVVPHDFVHGVPRGFVQGVPHGVSHGPNTPRTDTVFVSTNVMQPDDGKIDVAEAKSRREAASQGSLGGGVEGGQVEGHTAAGPDPERPSGSASVSKMSVSSLEFKPRSQMTKQEVTKLKKKLAKDLRRAESSKKGQIEDIGSFERHTRGIGSTLLGKMGYTKGEGLGKRRDGTALPIDAKPRAAGKGLGA